MPPLARTRIAELMDSPTIGEDEHRRALRGLARLNRLSGGARALVGPMRGLAARLGRPLTVMDVATGSGDIPLDLSRRLRGHGVAIRWTVRDISERAVGESIGRLRAAGLECRGIAGDFLADDSSERCDAVICSLFLHHLDPPEAGAALTRMMDRAEHLVLVNDLRRDRLGLAMARTVPRLVTRSRVVWCDAPASVRGAFTSDELKGLALGVGMKNVSVEPVWPRRMLLRWERPA